MTNDLIAELSRLHRRATDLRAREIQLADAGENDPASDTWKTAAIVAASAECEFHAALVTAWPTISRVLREAAAEGPKTRPMDLPVMLQHALNAGAAGVEWVDYDPTRLAVYQRLASALGVPLPPPPATETTKTEEPRND